MGYGDTCICMCSGQMSGSITVWCRHMSGTCRVYSNRVTVLYVCAFVLCVYACIWFVHCSFLVSFRSGIINTSLLFGTGFGTGPLGLGTGAGWPSATKWYVYPVL